MRADYFRSRRRRVPAVAADEALMRNISNSLPVEIGVLAIMPAVIVLLGLIFLVAAVCALVVHVLKRRTDIKFGVIGVTEDRRTLDLRQRGEVLEGAQADAILDLWAAEQQAAKEREKSWRRERLTLITNERDPFQRQAN